IATELTAKYQGSKSILYTPAGSKIRTVSGVVMPRLQRKSDGGRRWRSISVTMTALAMDCDAMRRCQAHDKTNDREAYEMRESFNISDPHCCVTVDLADRW